MEPGLSNGVWRRPLLWLLLLTCAVHPASGAKPKRVLIVHSFGSIAPPFTTVSSAFETTLTEEMGERIDLDSVSLDMARHAQPEIQDALVEFLLKREANWRPDLVVPIGSPAAIFVAQYRTRLFPKTPILYTALDQRRLPANALQTNATFVGESFNLPGVVKGILQLAPATTNIVMVLGATPLEQYWNSELHRELQPFTNRVGFTWLNNLSFDQMLKRVSHLPPRSFVFFGLLIRDATGVTHNQDEALKQLHAAANAPVNGLFLSQLGLGIVGGHLYPDEAEGVESARIAIRILRGTPASRIPPRVLPVESPHYDWRELRRWRISENRLPPGSTVEYRRSTLWGKYRWWILGALSLTAVETLLIIDLAVNLVKRRRAEKSLRDSENRLSLATDSAGAGLWSVELTTQKVWGTPRFRELFQFEPDEELTYDSLRERIHPEDREKLRQAVAATSQHGTDLQAEFRLVLSDGSLRWITTRGRRHVDASGKPGRVMGAAVDTTERKRGEDHLRESEARFRTIADSAPVLIWMADLEKQCTFVNKPWLDFTGRTAEQEMGLGWTHGVHPDDLPGFLNAYVASFDSRQPFVRQYRLRRHDGEYRWITNQGVPRYDPDAKFSGYIGSCTDITERRAAEERLRLDSAVIENMIDGVVLVRNRDQVIVNTNPTFDRLFGYRPGELIGQHIDVVNADGGPKPSPLTQTILRALRSSGQWHGEIPNRRKDGSTIWCRVSITTFPHPVHGEVGISIHADITEQRKAEAETQRLRQELAHISRVATMGELTASIAHELNQPLAAILSNAQAGLRFMAAGSPDLNELHDILKDIVADDQRAGQVIRHLRSLLKKGEAERHPLQLNNLINDVISVVRSDAVLRNVSFELDLAPQLRPVQADRIQLQQVMLNLVVNAFDAMAHVTHRPRQLILRTRALDNHQVQLDVIDNGPGIAPDKLGSIFEPFVTTKPGGMGMGLSVSRTIVSAHEGRLWAENNPQGGATFHMVLPAIPHDTTL